MTVVASVAAVAAAARVFVFSRAFLGALGFSRVFFSFLWSHRAFSNFLGFPVLLGTLRGAFGYLWGPFVSFGVPLGAFGVPLECPRASFRALWVPLASLGDRLGVPLGYLWGLFGRFGSLVLSGAARGCPKMLKIRKHMFLCVFAHV